MKIMSICAASMLCTSAFGVNIDVYPVIHPNAFGSPNFTESYQNGVYALQNGLDTYGTGPATWTKVTGPLSVFDTVVTGFPSWNSDADPAGTYGSEYAFELGNRLHFDYHAYSGDPNVTIDIADMSFSMVSTDPGATLTWAFPSYTYGPHRVGVNYGPDGLLGTGDDIVLTSGTGPVHEIFAGGGSGNAWDIYDSDPGANRQEKILGVLNKFSIPEDYDFTFTGTYTLGDVEGSASVRYLAQAVPDGGSLTFAFASCFGMMVYFKRRRS